MHRLDNRAQHREPDQTAACDCMHQLLKSTSRSVAVHAVDKSIR